MALGMSGWKVRRTGDEFRRGLSNGWEFEEDSARRLNYGAVIAVRGDVRAALDIGWAPFLRVSVGGSADDIISLPFLPAEKLGRLASDIAWAIARAREYGR